MGELAPRHQYVGDQAVADSHGRELGHAVLATVHAMEPPGQHLVFDRVVESGAPLATWRREERPATPLMTSLAAKRRAVDLPLKGWPSAAELAAQFAACTDRAIAERIRRKLRIREALGDGATFPLEIWGWRVGEALVLGTMAEAYSSIQSHVRAAFADRHVVWLNLVNGAVGYLPPSDPLRHGTVGAGGELGFQFGCGRPVLERQVDRPPCRREGLHHGRHGPRCAPPGGQRRTRLDDAVEHEPMARRLHRVERGKGGMRELAAMGIGDGRIADILIPRCEFALGRELVAT